MSVKHLSRAEHFREAEKLLDGLCCQHHPDYGTRLERTLEAQVHATLATANDSVSSDAAYLAQMDA